MFVSWFRLPRDEHADQSLPVILMGISWGGKIMAALAAQFPQSCDGLALLYPGLDPRLQPTRFQKLQLMFARDFEIKRKPVGIPCVTLVCSLTISMLRSLLPTIR